MAAHGIQGQPMTTFYVRVFRELPMFINLPDNAANDVLNEHLPLLVNDNTGAWMDTDFAV